MAVAYRTRLAGEAERTGRLARIEADMHNRLDLSEDPWLIVSLVPDLPGDFTIRRETFAEFQQEMQRKRFLFLDGGGTNFPHADVGHNRLRADDVFREDHPQPHYRAIEIHTDGSGTAAVRLYSLGTPTRAFAGQDSPLCTVSDEALAAALIGTLQCLASNAADRAHASGMAALRASLFVAANAPQTALGSIRSGFVSTSGHTVHANPEPVETFAPLDELVSSGRDLVEAAARLHHGVGHAFGEPELPQLTLDGPLAWPFWSRDRRPYVDAWADDNGVEIIGKPAGH
ncbi:MAG: hypothetical protein J0I40_10605 [Cellulomonas sp.]|nr:hypothetical protein [Cellulomonas sp.]